MSNIWFVSLIPDDSSLEYHNIYFLQKLKDFVWLYNTLNITLVGLPILWVLILT